ncbi:hypothetical protein ACFV2X_02735 [Streptomyces sp. NPDC059679]|uniref:hypothetical protein n=1 Tax=unclassified Streptomyces TaxID=2593676 RepID=UPI000B7C7CE0|nr:hypothetical protein [Streptomyces sp. NBS 14/10]KAK1179149.1 hypothetical protein B7755_013960 [Streptomyces sp. NBS 14/10]MDW6062852.1 hypothetical protein [Streptomyces sp. FXJ1.4098]NUS86471.1 hypothetical protein [Streptomyces sp.]
MVTPEVEPYIRQKFAENAGLTEEQLFTADATLADVIASSPRMTNSIDLMEAFARTANGLRKDYGVRVRLPALPLDTPITTVLKTFLEEFEREQKEAAV